MRQSMLLLIAAVLAPAAALEGQRNVPELADLLRGTAAYAERFEHEFAFIVAEERYLQEVRRAPSYVHDAKLRLWVPRTMAERYDILAQQNGGTEIDEGVSSTATYSNFPRFETARRVVN